jgi:S1-C subfamily serine protease
MKRTTLYSRSPRARRTVASGEGVTASAPSPAAGSAGPDSPGPPSSAGARLAAFARRHDRPLLMLGSGVLAALLAFGLYTMLTPAARRLTQDDIDGAVLHTLKKQPPAPSQASRAYDVIRPSVVLVRRLGEDKPKKLSLTGVGTGVVFSEDGMIFTNLHVVAGADDIGVTFADGTESEVELLDAQPENDLAVLRAKTLPDDLRPATLRSTRGLKTGDEVLAVGFPFGIGPTATWGVVSGLRREHYSEQGRRNLVDLIQFDAATNPGNSGGPLVTREGDVVGIVTSILNPTDESFFVGIAFAVPIENAARAAGVSPF